VLDALAQTVIGAGIDQLRDPAGSIGCAGTRGVGDGFDAVVAVIGVGGDGARGVGLGLQVAEVS